MTTRAWGQRWIAPASALLAIAIIAAHAGLTASGQWQADEYFNFGLLRQFGWSFLRDRLLHWSPRPLSESALALYALAVQALRRPLIAPFLLACWLLPLAAIHAGTRTSTHIRTSNGAGQGAPTRWDRTLPPLSLGALLLLLRPIDEMAYWPMGAAPYLACLAGILFVALRLMHGGARSPAGRIAAAAALLFATGSAELGVLFALLLCPMLAAIDLRQRARWWASLWLLPFAAACVSLALLWRGRVAAAADPSTAASPLYHHAIAALHAAVPVFIAELPHGTARLLGSGAALAGFTLCATAARPAAKPQTLGLAALLLALLGTCALSIVASLYQFGQLCCERHATFRQCLLLLALLTAAHLLAGRWPATASPQARPIGAALLATAMLLGAWHGAAGVAHDYRQMPQVLAARHTTWQSGQHPGSTMLYQPGPDGAVVALGHWIAPGTYAAGPGALWYVTGLLQFFNKTRVMVAFPAPPTQVATGRNRTSGHQPP